MFVSTCFGLSFCRQLAFEVARGVSRCLQGIVSRIQGFVQGRRPMQRPESDPASLQGREFSVAPQETDRVSGLATEVLFVYRRPFDRVLIENNLPSDVSARFLTIPEYVREFTDNASSSEQESALRRRTFLVYEWEGWNACIVFRQPEGRFQRCRDIARRVLRSDDPSQSIHLLIIRRPSVSGIEMTVEGLAEAQPIFLREWADRGRIHLFDRAVRRNPLHWLLSRCFGHFVTTRIQQREQFHQLLRGQS